MAKIERSTADWLHRIATNSRTFSLPLKTKHRERHHSVKLTTKLDLNNDVVQSICSSGPFVQFFHYSQA